MNLLINTFGVLIIFTSVVNIGESAFIRCYNGSLDNYLVVELSQPVLFEEPSCIDRNIPTVLYTFGYRGKVSGPATTAMLSAYLATKKRNVLLLDWENEAQVGLLGIQLTYALYAMPNAKKIGNQLGETLVRLNLTDIHLIGHSLGAHLMGHAGRIARKLGAPIRRITGLDPAKALYEGTFTTQRGLDRTCGRFVDIIHSDPQNYGSSKATGTMDFWPNYGSVKNSDGVQPGCPKGNFESFSKEDLCSHDRSWQFFSEAITNPTGFPAALQPNSRSWFRNSNITSATYLGDLVNTRASGTFFLATNPSSPFARYEAGLTPDDDSIRLHRSVPRIRKLFQDLS